MSKGADGGGSQRKPGVHSGQGGVGRRRGKEEGGDGTREIGQVVVRREKGRSSWRRGLPHKGISEHHGPGVKERVETRVGGPRDRRPASMRVKGPGGKEGR